MADQSTPAGPAAKPDSEDRSHGETYPGPNPADGSDPYGQDAAVDDDPAQPNEAEADRPTDGR
jgi:hypothetical protein